MSRPAVDDSLGTIEPGRGYRSFAPTPEALLLDLAVTAVAVRLWGILDRQAKGRQSAIDSLTKLAAKLGCSPRHVSTLIRQLAATGWLDVHRTPGRVNRYVLHYEPPPAEPDTGPPPSSTTPEPQFLTPNGGQEPQFMGVTNHSSGHTRAVPSLREVSEGEVPPPPSQPPPKPEPPGRAYPAQCARHQHDRPPPCGQCKETRLTHQAATSADGATVPEPVVCPIHQLPHAPRAECRSCRADRIATPEPKLAPTWPTPTRRTGLAPHRTGTVRV